MVEHLAAESLAGRGADPDGVIFCFRKVERESCPGSAVQIDRVGIPRVADGGRGGAIGNASLDDPFVGTQSAQVAPLYGLLENAKLLPKRGPVAAGRFGVLEGAVLVPRREGVIEAVDDCAAAEDEFPGLDAVREVGGSFESGLVVAQWAPKRIVVRCGAALRVVKVKD